MAVLLVLDGLQVGTAVEAGGGEDQRDAVRGHAHPPQHRAEAVVQRYRQAQSDPRLARTQRAGSFGEAVINTAVKMG